MQVAVAAEQGVNALNYPGPAFVAKQDGPGKLLEVVRDSLKKDKAQNERGNTEDA